MSLQRLASGFEWGWLAAVLGANVAALAYSAYGFSTEPTAMGMFAAEIFPSAQLSMLAAWLVLGPGPMRLRWVAVPAFLGILYLCRWLTYPTVQEQTFGIALEVAGLVALMAWGVRLLSGPVCRDFGKGSSIPVQFSIRGLLLATTLAAVAVAAGKWVYANVEAVEPAGEIDLQDLNGDLARAAVAFGLAATSIAAWWAVFRPRRVWLTGLAVAISAGLSGILMSWLLHESDAWDSFGLWWSLHAVVILGTLAPLRQIGFRLQLRLKSSVPSVATVGSIRKTMNAVT